MSDVRQALIGILAALISAVIILGSIVLALSETGQKIARLPETGPELTTPTPPMPTYKPGEATYTAAPTRLPQTATAEPNFLCQPRPGWRAVDVFPGDTWELLAQTYGLSLEELLQGNCMELKDIKNNKLEGGMMVYIRPSQTTATASMSASTTATLTGTPVPTKTKSAQSKPKATRCAGPPSYWVIYYVKSGDTLFRISQLTGTTWVQLRDANCLATTTIYPGQRLWVPRQLAVGTPVRSPTPRPTRAATLTRTVPPTAVPSVTTEPPPTDVPTNTPLPTSPPQPSDTPVTPDTPIPTAYP